MKDLPFHCRECKNCNEHRSCPCEDWVNKWLARPFTAFEFARRLYNNSWCITCNFYFAKENVINKQYLLWEI